MFRIRAKAGSLSYQATLDFQTLTFFETASKFCFRTLAQGYLSEG